MRTLLLAAATLGTTACLGATDPVRARAADVGVTISASRAPALDADAQQTAVTPAFVDIAITAPVGGATAELLRTSVVPDSAGRRVPLRVELGACLGEKDTCALTITVRLRAANGAPYDSSTVGPISVSPGASLELPVIRFRPTARLALLDSTLRVTLGGSTTVRVNALDAASQLLLGRALVWRSLDPAIATVDGSGRVTALGQGRARIEAAREGLTVTAVVQATAVEQLQLRASVTRARVGDRVTLTPTISVVGGRSARVTYASSNPAVAVVDSTGQVTAVGPGAVQLSATAVADTSQRAQVTLTVDPVRAAVSARFVSTGSRGTLPGNVLDLEAVAADSVFAVGCGDTGSGFLARFDGSDWRNIEAPGLFCPRAVEHLSDGTLLVLNHSQLLRYRNSTWSSEALPVTASVSSLATVGTTIFVGGANGTVLRWNGSWTTYTLGSGADVTQLSAAEDGAVYAATGGQTPQLHRFSNGAWQPVDAGVPWTFITAVQVYSATEVFVGGATASGFTTVRFSGSGWSAPTSTVAVPSFFRAFAAAGSTRYGLTAQGEVYRWTGTTWALEQSTGLQEAHLVGGATWLVAAGWHGSSWRQSQGSWRRLTHVPALTALWASSPTFMLAGGHEGAIEQFDGTAWRSVKAPGARHVRAIFGADSTDVWVSATGMFYRYRSGVWDSVPNPFGDVSAFWGDRRDRIFATAVTGRILRFDGTAWQPVAELASGLLALTGVTLPDGSVVMYAGGFGQLHRSTGGAWTAEPVGGATVYSLYAADTANVYAATMSDAPLRRVNGQWVSMAGAIGASWIGGTGPADLYAGGCDAPQHFDGTSWRALPVSGPFSPVCGYFGGSSHVVFRTGGFVVGRMLRTLLVGVGPEGQTPGVPR